MRIGILVFIVHWPRQVAGVQACRGNAGMALLLWAQKEEAELRAPLQHPPELRIQDTAPSNTDVHSRGIKHRDVTQSLKHLLRKYSRMSSWRRASSDSPKNGETAQAHNK